MGCVYTHRRKPTIEGCGSPSYVRSAMQKVGKIIEKLGRLVELYIKHRPQG